MNRKIASLTSALIAQNLSVVLAGLFSVAPLLGSNRKYGRRAVAVTLVSTVEQFCRILAAEMMARGKLKMPTHVEVPLADLELLPGLAREALASFALNFSSAAAILNLLCSCGLGHLAKNNPRLLGDLIPVFAVRNDLVHTSVPVDFDMRAAYEAVLRFILAIARHVPGMEIEVRLFQGDILANMRMAGASREAYGEAARLCDALVRDKPKDPEAHARLGLALAGLGRHMDALASLDKSLSLDPERAATHLGRGQSLAKLGRHAEALASLDRSLRPDPALIHAHLLRAVTLANTGRLDDALAACDEAIEIDASLPRAHFLRGEILAEMGRLDDALASHAKAIDLDGYDEVARAHRAILLNRMGRRRDALADCDAAIELDPDYAEAHMNRADILDAMGEYDEALCSYSRAIRLDPRHAGAHAGKGRVLERLGRHGEAATYCKVARDLGAARP